jgi:hypothetical protein
MSPNILPFFAHSPIECKQTVRRQRRVRHEKFPGLFSPPPVDTGPPSSHFASWSVTVDKIINHVATHGSSHASAKFRTVLHLSRFCGMIFTFPVDPPGTEQGPGGGVHFINFDMLSSLPVPLQTLRGEQAR